MALNSCQSRFTILPNIKLTLKIAKDLNILAKVAKLSQILSHLARPRPGQREGTTTNKECDRIGLYFNFCEQNVMSVILSVNAPLVFATNGQRDQMYSFFFNFWPFITVEICSKA